MNMLKKQGSNFLNSYIIASKLIYMADNQYLYLN